VTATVSVRRAGAADLDALVRLAVSFRDHRGEPDAPSDGAYRRAYERLLIDPASEFLLAEDAAGEAQGFLLARDRADSESAGLACEIEDLFVVAASQRRGVGRALLTHALESAAARGVVKLMLTTNERNEAALALYGGFGLAAASARWEGGRQLWLQRAIAPAAAAPALLAIDHVQLAMPPGGEARARAFYESALGLAEVAKPVDLAMRGGCWFERGALRVHLGVEPAFRAARKAHPAFRVSGLDALLERCRAAGVATSPVEARGGARHAYVDDPFGNRIELVEIR
jgi:ribosomal protein S18 acetylase RimI-like enzyme/catechol 2,3-dioxygenase-like lactoylglutathione lyase family enzyme